MALTGFLVAHQCAPTSADAIRLLLADFPVVGDRQFTTAVSATFVAPSTFNLTLKSDSLNAATTITTTKTFTLARCDPALPVDVNVTVFDPILAAGIWMFAITVVLGCWVLAKNAGIIIDMIRRW